LAAALPAQGAAPRPAEPVALVTELRWSEARSLALFEACDRDADDLLDVLELRRALVDLQGTRDPAVFRRLDTDNSGFVEWPEFDARYRTSLETIGKFRVQPLREVPLLRDPTTPASDVDPSERILGALDEDGDEALSPAEFTKFLRRMAIDVRLADKFALLDLDDSGQLELLEFAPVLQWAPQVWTQMGRTEEVRRAMPEEYRSADRDLNGVIDAGELRSALARIHPSLARWTESILDAADRQRSGTLGAAELFAARAAARSRGAER
jgi:Ca2+-binding EF-hand superfamily protein